MASARKNSCVSDAAVAPEPVGDIALRTDADLPSPENLLQEYKELRERLHRTTNALGSAAHDLKTPLSILNGYIELLQSEKLGPISARQREVLQDMRDSGKRLQQFIQDFLTYSALETGGLPHEVRLPPTLTTVSLVSAACGPTAFRKKESHSTFWLTRSFQFSRSTLRSSERIISNLLENSYKFTPKGGTVWLHAEPHMWERRAASVPSTSERAPSKVAAS